MVAAGILLDRASEWYFLSTVKEALILVPALLGLKGNLEMTLASRLSTMVCFVVYSSDTILSGQSRSNGYPQTTDKYLYQ